MSREAAVAAADRLEADEEFARRVKDAGSPEASIAMLRDAGFDVTPTDMSDVLVDRYGEHFTEEQLDAIAGGYIDNVEEWFSTPSGIAHLSVAAGAVALTAAAAAAV